MMKRMSKKEAYKKLGKHLRWGREGHPYTKQVTDEILSMRNDEVIYVPVGEWPLKQGLSQWLSARRHMRRSRLKGIDAHARKVLNGEGWVVFKGEY